MKKLGCWCDYRNAWALLGEEDDGSRSRPSCSWWLQFIASLLSFQHCLYYREGVTLLRPLQERFVTVFRRRYVQNMPNLWRCPVY